MKALPAEELFLIERKNNRKTKLLLVGLHNWSGENRPTDKDIDQTPIIEQGVMHINSIKHIGGEILGLKLLEEDNLKPHLQFEAGYLIDGFENIGKLPAHDYEKYSRRTTYGLNSIRLKAEKHFVKNS